MRVSVALARGLLLPHVRCSRREADYIIANGWLRVQSVEHGDRNSTQPTVGSLADNERGNRLCVLGEQVGADSEGLVTPQFALESQGEAWLMSQKSVVLLHKPVGFLSGFFGGEGGAWRDRNPSSTAAATGKQPQQARHLREARDLLKPKRFVRLPSDLINGGGSFDVDAACTAAISDPRAFHVCGRLDQQSRGLLVLTSDGAVARRIIGEQPEASLAKTYSVRTAQPVAERQLESLLGERWLDGKQLAPMQVSRGRDSRSLRFVLRQGRKHQIRRVCRQVGLSVVDLFRTNIGPWSLRGIEEGRWTVVSSATCPLLPSSDRNVPSELVDWDEELD